MSVAPQRINNGDFTTMRRNVKHFLFCLLLSLSVIFPDVSYAGSAGKVKNGVYYSPAGNFQVPLPKGIGMRLNDRYDKGGGGIVSFHDDFGSLNVIHYVRIPAQYLPKLQTPKAKQDLFQDWLRNFAMPNWFLPASPQGNILREARGTFEGMPVVFALVDLPGASTALITSGGQTRRGDSRRGLVIFLKGSWLYMLATETTDFLQMLTEPTGRKNKPPPVKADNKWMSFVGREKSFYHSITFVE